jgi:hypothetical protein
VAAVESSFLVRLASVAVLVGAAVGVSPAAGQASAYSLEGCAWPATSIAYTDQSGSYGDATERAVEDWNGVDGSPIHLYAADGAPLTLQARNYGRTGYDGITVMSCDAAGRFVRVTSSYNTYYADRYGPDARRSLIGHEIGHALGLAHSGSLPCPVPLMYRSSDRYFRCGDVGPQGDDLAGLEAVVQRSQGR